MQILIITDMIPYPPVSGGLVRVYNLLRRVARQHQVSLAALIETSDQAKGISHLQEFCHRVETGNVRRRHPLAHLPGLFRYALAGKPLELKFWYSEELANGIRRLCSTIDFDIVQIEQSVMAQYLEVLPPDAHCKRILMLHDIDFEQAGRIYRFERRLDGRIRTLLYGLMMRCWEPRYAGRFDRCATVSEVDRRLLMAANPRLCVDVIPNGVDTQVYQPLPQEDVFPALLFIGDMSYVPCVDAMLYFCREVLPRIRNVVGEVELWIVGKDPLPEVARLGSNGVHVTGQVDSVMPYYERSTVCVVPLRAGGGTRLKILEAMALGRPVVSTTIGCEGLDVVDGEHLLIADSPERFAEKTVRLLKDRMLYRHIATNARQLVVARYDWDVIARQLMQVYAEMVE
jgi:sugar transferase (PEP-CTERM/EpsH1 system associated)